jgi:hypothetical protein
VLSLEPGVRIELAWPRNKVVGLFRAMLLDGSLGTARIGKRTFSINPRDSWMRFHRVGDEKPLSLGLAELDWVIKG